VINEKRELMRLFTQLFNELDTTTRTVEKVQALARYFAAAPPRDAAWALFFLIGRKIKRVINSRLLRDWLAAEAGLPAWIVDESYHAVGDVAETLALLLPDRHAASGTLVETAVLPSPGLLFSDDELLAASMPKRLRNLAGNMGCAPGAPIPAVDRHSNGGQAQISLHELAEERIVPLAGMPPAAQRAVVVRTWRELDARERFLWHKLLFGEFRVGVARTLVARALAKVAGVPAEIMEHRLMGHWEPTAEDFLALIEPTSQRSDPGQPYPFFLANPLEGEPQDLGTFDEWQAEWKWDGIRAQLIRRQGHVLVWSRGEELVTDRFPEVTAVGNALDDGTVLDGEIVAWRDERPLPFAALQTRIGRIKLSPKVLASAPVVFMAFDVLELEGVDMRQSPLVERRAKLEDLVGHLPATMAVRISPHVTSSSWEELIELRRSARERNVEGIMFKRRDSAYGVGRPKGVWWKWKIDPLAIDAVLIYAQPGHGRRASLFTDYTFGVWHEGELVPVAKAYSGLTDAEIRKVDAFVRRNTIERHGPLRMVRPELVFELHFDAIQRSTRHRSGLAVRFPRMNRWRNDKRAEEADSLATLIAMAERYARQTNDSRSVSNEMPDNGL
jgi:DNA ligase-1